MADKMFGISLEDQRMKYGVVAVLAAILLTVVAWPGNAKQAPVAGVAAPARPGDAHRQPAQASGKAAASNAANVAVKKPVARRPVAAVSEEELQSTLQFNPFVASALLQAQLPGSQQTSSQQAEEQSAEKARALAAQQRLSEFKEQKVSVVFRTTDGTTAALIGKRVVREGDVIDGVRIVSISHEGVLVEAIASATEE